MFDLSVHVVSRPTEDAAFARLERVDRLVRSVMYLSDADRRVERWDRIWLVTHGGDSDYVSATRRSWIAAHAGVDAAEVEPALIRIDHWYEMCELCGVSVEMGILTTPV